MSHALLDGLTLQPALDMAVRLRATLRTPIGRDRADRRLSGPYGRPLVSTDGRYLRIADWNDPDLVWAITHVLAHMLQWHAKDAQSFHRLFRFYGRKAQKLSMQRLDFQRGEKFAHTLRQEFEAHLITASILAECYPTMCKIQLREFAIDKAVSDLSQLSQCPLDTKQRTNVVARYAMKFSQEIGGLPSIQQNMNVQFKTLSTRFIPYISLR